MSAAAQRPAYAYDPARLRRGVRKGRERGCWVYIPRDVLQDAGVSPDEPPPVYRLTGRQRRPGAKTPGTVLVSLYREP